MTLLIALGLLLAGLTTAPVIADKGQFTFDGWQGPPMRVFTSRPDSLEPDMPVVFVMHGVRRNADEYRDQWHELALEHDFFLVVPEFTEADFPGSRGYNLGFREDEQGRPRPRKLWSYSAIEPIFDEVRRREGLGTKRYALYGHSAGSQFVHRFIYYVPDARVSRIVPANAGWYLMPEADVPAPYGLEDAGLTAEMLVSAWRKPVTVLLGELDTDPRHRHLRRAPQAMAQGAHRFARGQRFFALNRDAAEQKGVPFGWRLATVPGVGHENRRMAPAAVPYLLD
jgi:pimeloyl-ACP methyl ester carboxylesterase